MNVYAIPTLIGSLLALAIAVIVLLNDPRSRVNIIFSLFGFSLFGWLFSFTLAYSSKEMWYAHFFGRLGCQFVDLAGPFFYHFIVTFLRLKKEMKWVYTVYFLVMGILILGGTTNAVFLPEPHHYYWGYYPKAGPLHHLAIIVHSLVMLRTITLLYSFIKRGKHDVSRTYYNQMNLIFWAIWVLIFPGLTDYIPKYGIEIYPLGWAFVIAFCVIVGYAIVKHQLMDIRIVIRGTLIYSLLIGFITAVFVVMILMLEKYFQGFAGYRSLLASMVTSFIIALSFNPVKNKIQSFVDVYFFRGTAREIVEENIRLRQELLKQDRMRAVATLAASMAHEIKNPLTVIKTFTEYLPERSSDKGFIDKFSRLVRPQVERINYALQQLLDFSKPSLPDLKEVRIYDVLNETLDLLSSDFLKHRINAALNFTSEDVVIMADPNQLKQVFLNLLLNSIDAMPGGGDIVVSGTIKDDLLEVCIQDTGEGIPKEKLGNIFQPFYTTKATGTGLGLSVVRDILSLHKAKIRAESEEGKGMRVIIEFHKI